MNIIGQILLSIVISVFSVLELFSQSRETFIVEGEVKQPLKLTVEGLAKLKNSEVRSKDKDGKEHMYKGVMLSAILDSAGVTLGKDLRGENLAKYVVARATDGHEIIFSLPEIDPELTDNVVLLAYQVDGKPLGALEGPFRLVVPNDKKHARWIRQLSLIKVLYSKGIT